jgi:hypothetical protein
MPSLFFFRSWSAAGWLGVLPDDVAWPVTRQRITTRDLASALVTLDRDRTSGRPSSFDIAPALRAEACRRQRSIEAGALSACSPCTESLFTRVVRGFDSPMLDGGQRGLTSSKFTARAMLALPVAAASTLLRRVFQHTGRTHWRCRKSPETRLSAWRVCLGQDHGTIRASKRFDGTLCPSGFGTLIIPSFTIMLAAHLCKGTAARNRLLLKKNISEALICRKPNRRCGSRGSAKSQSRHRKVQTSICFSQFAVWTEVLQTCSRDASSVNNTARVHVARHCVQSTVLARAPLVWQRHRLPACATAQVRAIDHLTPASRSSQLHTHRRQQKPTQAFGADGSIRSIRRA